MGRRIGARGALLAAVAAGVRKAADAQPYAGERLRAAFEGR